MAKPEWTQPTPTLDLRKYCRSSDVVETNVFLKWDWDRGHEFLWLKLGEVRLNSRAGHNRHLWRFDSYLGEHTDFEHDSAHILRMELIGVEFESLYYGQTILTGFINPNLDVNNDFDTFNVPSESYDPFAGAKDCEDCKGQDNESQPHKVVVEEHYIPPNNPDLYEKIKGKRIEIRTGKVWKK